MGRKAGKKEIKDNIVKIEDEIAKLEDEAKPKAKGKKEKKTKVVKTKKEKTPIEKTPAREVQKAIEIAHPHHQKFKIDETAKEQQLGHLTLIKKNDNCFVLYLKKEGMEITFLKTSTADGMKWVTTYYKDKETTHNTLQDAVNAAVDMFYRKMLVDERVSHFFDDIDMDQQILKQKGFLTMVFGDKR